LVRLAPLIVSLTTCVVSAASIATSAMAASPGCYIYKISSGFHVVQANGTRVTFIPDVKDGVVTGKAAVEGKSEGVGRLNGTFECHILNVTVTWSSGIQGVYSGAILADGYFHGYTYDTRFPSKKVSWESANGLSYMPCSFAPREPCRFAPSHPNPR
jgi:hypothetical protein